MIENALRENAARGAALLDGENPNWYLSIDVADLEMKSCDRCVLGQLYKTVADDMGYTYGFYAGVDLLDVESAAYGFELPLRLPGQHDAYSPKERWAMLRDAWITEIKARCNR